MKNSQCLNSLKLNIIAITIVLAFALGIYGQKEWRPVGCGITANISGMALIRHQKPLTELLVVTDNKNDRETRIAVVTIDGEGWPKYSPLTWPGKEPYDLEALTSIPGVERGYMALGSRGELYRIELAADRKSIRVSGPFNLPSIPDKADFEGFALQKLNDKLIAVWADRATEDGKYATLFFTEFDLTTNKPGAKVETDKVTVPFPTKWQVRHISDIKVTPAGRVHIVSASDPGENDGPFSSAYYMAGELKLNEQKQLKFFPAPNLTPLKFSYRKAEALELLSPGGDLIFGSDDENFGASLLFNF